VDQGEVGADGGGGGATGSNHDQQGGEGQPVAGEDPRRPAEQIGAGLGQRPAVEQRPDEGPGDEQAADGEEEVDAAAQLAAHRPDAVEVRRAVVDEPVGMEEEDRQGGDGAQRVELGGARSSGWCGHASRP
jgi:hypothetical protein